jgi:hypothetical protein
VLSKLEPEDVWQDQHDCGAEQNRKYTNTYYLSS